MGLIINRYLIFTIFLCGFYSCSQINSHSNSTRSISSTFSVNDLSINQSNLSNGLVKTNLTYKAHQKDAIIGFLKYKKLEQYFSLDGLNFQTLPQTDFNTISILSESKTSDSLISDFKNLSNDDLYRYLNFSRISVAEISPAQFIDKEKINPKDYWALIEKLTIASQKKNSSDELFNTRDYIAKILSPLINYNREMSELKSQITSTLEEKTFREKSSKYLTGLMEILNKESDGDIIQKLDLYHSQWIKLQANPIELAQGFLGEKFYLPKILYGEDISEQVQKIIRSAEESLDISVSFLRGEGAISSIEKALNNGAKVRLLLDGRNLNKGEKEKKLFEEFQKRFQGKNIEIAYLSPSDLGEVYGEWYPIYHRKMVSVDKGKRFVISSDNLDTHKNIDSALVFSDQENTHLLDLFEQDWKLATQKTAPINLVKNPDNVKLFGKGLVTADLRSEVINQIENAKERIWLSIFEINDEEILNKLIEKKKVNPHIDIKVLICWSKLSVWFNGKKYERDRHIGTIKKLNQNGITVKTFPEKSEMRLHARTLITDDNIVSGSSDYTNRALDRNLDLTVSTKMSIQDNQEISEKFSKLWDLAEVSNIDTHINHFNEKASHLFESFFSSIYSSYKKNGLTQERSAEKVTLRIEDYNESVEQIEKEFNSLLSEYEQKHGDLSLLDISLSDTTQFENQLKDLKKLELKLDELIKVELDSLANIQANFAREIALTRPEFAQQASEIQKLLKNYEVNKLEYGGAKDYKRYAAFTELFFKTKELYESSSKLKQPGLKKLLLIVERTILKVTNLLSLSTRLSLPSLQMFFSAFQNVTHSKIGFGKSVDLFFKQWGNYSKISTQVDGLDNLKNQKRLRLFIPTHRDANLDAVAFAALNVDNPVVFGALNLKNHPIFGLKDNPLVKPMIHSLERNDSFILAGAAEKPIDKFIRLIHENKAKNVLIYPEGQVSLGLKESRPVRENFSKALISRLLEEKIDFELVPVSYINGAQFFEYHNEFDYIKTEESKLKINVHKPITANEIAIFLKQHDSSLLNTYLRFNWLFNLDTNDELLLGQGRWNTIKNSFHQKLTNESPDCKSLIKSFL